MERLTERLGNSVILNGCRTQYAASELPGQYTRNAIVRLSAYEDSGLTPEEVAELKTLWDMYGGEEGITAAFKAKEELELIQKPEQCGDCSGIMYRQTKSGKIVPCDKTCTAKKPPCYKPDGDGCAYQIYGDNNDEPIDKCKECPLCFSDKVRHVQDAELAKIVRCKDCGFRENVKTNIEASLDAAEDEK